LSSAQDCFSNTVEGFSPTTMKLLLLLLLLWWWIKRWR